MERLGLSGYGLSRELGTSEAAISNIRNGKNPPNILLVQALLNKYEEVDPGWLLSGKGRMFRRPLSEETTSPGPVQSVKGSDDIAERLSRIEDLLIKGLSAQLERDVLVDESISDLSRQVDEQEKLLKAFKKVLDKRP
ncbi:MAG: helix-turn-helix transcriptional regulator [Flavobacteriales bacterium]|nr:helix-turn-helix transcriptional regulator [Flavobacteriales bacterium]